MGSNEGRGSLHQRQATETRLMAEVKQAREIYEFAKLAFDEATERAQTIGLDHPDSNHGMLNATKEYNRALRRYTEALKSFSQFVLRG